MAGTASLHQLVQPVAKAGVVEAVEAGLECKAVSSAACGRARAGAGAGPCASAGANSGGGNGLEADGARVLGGVKVYSV